MAETLPMFPLNTVLFPGVVVPLRVFEDRYRALVHHLLRVEDPSARLFGSVGIREGYEVGDHGAQSLFRVGCRLQLGEVSPQPDGSFEIVATGRDRIRLNRLLTDGPFPAGEVDLLDADVPRATTSAALVTTALEVFEAYRSLVGPWRGDPHPGPLPQDPVWLSWVLAAVAPLPLPQRQALLESDDATERLLLVTRLLHDEVRTMSAMPSLPATEVARTGWSPN